MLEQLKTALSAILPVYNINCVEDPPFIVIRFGGVSTETRIFPVWEVIFAATTTDAEDTNENFDQYIRPIITAIERETRGIVIGSTMEYRFRLDLEAGVVRDRGSRPPNDYETYDAVRLIVADSNDI